METVQPMSNRESNALSLATGVELEEYRIEGVLGKGGFAITYAGLDLRLKKRVAIKELLPDGIATRIAGDTVVAQTEALKADYEWAIDSFIKEAQTIASFEHPNIVRVSRFFRQNGTAYMVMPFIEGSDLKKLIKKKGKYSYQELLAILLPLLGGLSEVHKAGVLHRDIKLENIYLTTHGVPILIDFGAARQQVGGKSLDMTSIITPGYAAIEQYSTDAKYQGPWSDIYSMAACIYHMITGQKPAPASERSDAARNQQADPMPRLSQLQPQGFPPQFLNGVDQALQMGEQQRPQNVETWLSVLGCTGQVGTSMINPTISPASPGAGPAGKPAPKKKGLLVALVLVMIAGLAGFGGMVWMKLNEDNSSTTESNGSDESSSDENEVEEESKDRYQSMLNDLEVAIKVGEYDKARDMIRDLDLKELSSAERQRLAGLRDLRGHEMKSCVAWLSLQGGSQLTVSIDGRVANPSQGRYRLQGVGKHSVTFSREGYDSLRDVVEVRRKDQTIDYGSVTLSENYDTRMAKQRAEEARKKQEELDRIRREKEEAEMAKKKRIDDLKEELSAFSDDYYRRLANNDPDIVGGLYADFVDYEYIKGRKASRAEVYKSFSANIKRWPNRNYTPVGVTKYETINAASTQARLYFSYNYSYSNAQGKKAKGLVHDVVTIQKTGNSWEIIKWEQGVNRFRNDLDGL